MGFGRTALGRSFVYHAGTAVDSVGDTCGSRGGMVSWPRSWHTPCRVWYWCQATRSLRSTRIVQGMWSHRDCGMKPHVALSMCLLRSFACISGGYRSLP